MQFQSRNSTKPQWPVCDDSSATHTHTKKKKYSPAAIVFPSPPHAWHSCWTCCNIGPNWRVVMTTPRPPQTEQVVMSLALAAPSPSHVPRWMTVEKRSEEIRWACRGYRANAQQSTAATFPTNDHTLLLLFSFVFVVDRLTAKCVSVDGNFLRHPVVK